MSFESHMHTHAQPIMHIYAENKSDVSSVIKIPNIYQVIPFAVMNIFHPLPVIEPLWIFCTPS